MSHPSTSYVFGFDVSFLLNTSDCSSDHSYIVAAAWRYADALGLFSCTDPQVGFCVERSLNPFIFAKDCGVLGDILAGSHLHVLASRYQRDIQLILGVSVPGEALPTSRSIVCDAALGASALAATPVALIAQKLLNSEAHSPRDVDALRMPTLHFICGY